jgi:hypothetical protein
VRFPRKSPGTEDSGSLTRKPAQNETPHQESDETLALAHAIHGAGMAGVASFALHILKPLHWMGGQAVWILQPFIDSLGVGARRRSASAISTGDVARLLEKDGGLDELAAQLERLQREDGGV